MTCVDSDFEAEAFGGVGAFGLSSRWLAGGKRRKRGFKGVPFRGRSERFLLTGECRGRSDGVWDISYL